MESGKDTTAAQEVQRATSKTIGPSQIFVGQQKSLKNLSSNALKPWQP
jgi:hypothetical protein